MFTCVRVGSSESTYCGHRNRECFDSACFHANLRRGSLVFSFLLGSMQSFHFELVFIPQVGAHIKPAHIRQVKFSDSKGWKTGTNEDARKSKTAQDDAV